MLRTLLGKGLSFSFLGLPGASVQTDITPPLHLSVTPGMDPLPISLLLSFFFVMDIHILALCVGRMYHGAPVELNGHIA